MSKTINNTQYLSYQEVAKELGFSDSTISVMVSRGTFEAVKFKKDAKKYIEKTQVERYKQSDTPELDNRQQVNSLQHSIPSIDDTEVIARVKGIIDMYDKGQVSKEEAAKRFAGVTCMAMNIPLTTIA
jgi:excisionase family DNA binding protein